MKRFTKKLFAATLLVVAALCLGIFAACGDWGRHDETDTTTVTVDFKGGVWNGESSASFTMDADGDLVAVLEEKGYQDATKVGYEFAGWELPEKTGDKYAAAITVAAKWDAISYTITYKYDGGELADGVTNPATYTIEDEVEFAAPEREGFQFEGWVVEETDAPIEGVAAGSMGNITVKATWSPVQAVVTLYLPGSDEPYLDVLTFDYDEEVTFTQELIDEITQDLTDEGLVYVGLLNEDGTLFEEGTKVTEPQNLRVTIDLYSNGMQFEEKTPDAYTPNTEINFSDHYYAASITNEDLNGKTALYYPSYYNGKPVEVILDATNLNAQNESEKIYFSTLVSAYIPTNVKLIWNAGDNANYYGLFNGAAALEKVTFGANSKLQEIHDVAMFKNTASLTSVELPDSLEYITTASQNGLFSGTVGLTSFRVPKALKKLPQNTLAGAEGLTSFTIPEGAELTEIGSFGGKYAGVTALDFSNATKLTKLPNLTPFYNVATFKFPDSLEEIGTFANQQNPNTVATELDFSKTKIENFGSNTFQYMTALATVKFPATLTTVGQRLFGANNGANTHITELDFSGTQLQTVPELAFADMTALETVKFPATLKTLGTTERTMDTNIKGNSSAAVFYNSSAVRSISFNGAELSTLGDYALYNLPQLGDVSVTIAAGGKMGAYVFANSGSANTVSVTLGSGATVSHAAFFFAQALTLELNGFETFGGEIIATKPGQGSSPATTDDIDALKIGTVGGLFVTTTTIADFSKYPVLSGSTVKTVRFNSALTELKNFAFALSSAVPEFANADRVTTCGAYLFYKSNITSINFENTPFKNITEKMFYGSENLATITGGWDLLEEVETGAFVGTGVTAFTIGRNLTYIDPTAFTSGTVSYTVGTTNSNYEQATNEEGDTEYILYKNEGDVSIFYDAKLAGDEDFERDFTATELELTVLGNAYAGNTHLTGIKMPASITEVSDGAFANCTALVYAQFAGALTKIGANAFENCTSLLTFEIPTGVTTIGEKAFYNTGLTELTADEGSELASIGASAFEGTKLKSVDLSAATKFEGFGEKAFANLDPELGDEETFSFKFPTEATEKFEGLPASLFQNDTCLTAIEIPAYITTFEAGVFTGTGLTSLSFAPGSKMSTFGRGALTGLHITELSLPDGLTSIGKAAFAGMTELESIVIPANAVIEAGTATTGANRGAFVGCTALTTVEFKGTEVTVPDYTFYGCTSLATVNFANVEKIGLAAFYNTGFESVTLGAIKNIGKAAFAGSTQLTTLTIDAAATFENGTTSTLGKDTGAFAGCTQLATVNITQTAAVDGDAAASAKLTVGDYTFYNCTALDTIDFTKVGSVGKAGFTNASFATAATNDLSGLSAIGTAAFAGTGLKAITISSNVELTKGTSSTTSDTRGPFSTCTSLASVTIIKSGDTLLAIPDFCFYNSHALRTFDFTNVSTIGKEAFEISAYNVENGFVDATLNLSGVTEIGEKAFQYQTLAAVTFKDNVSIGKTAFYGCKKLTALTLPQGVSITAGSGESAGAFGQCILLAEVKFAAGAEDIVIPAYTFVACEELATVDFTKIKTIGNYAFKGCALTSVTLKSGATVGTNAFEGCADLTTFNLAEDAEDFAVPGSAFKNCAALESFPFDKVKTIGSNAFDGCASLTEVTFAQEVTLGNYAFQNCTALAKVDFEHVTAIGTSAFAGCAALMEAVARPSSATGHAVAGTAFQNCTSLITVTIPSTITSIGSNAFQYCYRLVVVINQSTLSLTKGTTANGAVAQYAKVIVNSEAEATALSKTKDGNFMVLKETADAGTDTYSVIAYLGKSTDGSVTFPAELTLDDKTESGTKVTQYALYDYLFYKNTTIKNVTLTDAVTAIGKAAFNGSSVETVNNIPAGCTVAAGTTAGEGAFENCAKLKSVTFAATAWDVPDYAFANCTQLGADAEDPGFDFTKVKAIGVAAFLNTGFKSVTLPATATLADKNSSSGGSFGKCLALTTVTFNSTSMNVPAYSFYGCTSLKTVNFENVTNIGKAAFYNTGFVTLKLNSTTTIFSDTSSSNAAFGSCTSLTTFEFIDKGRWTAIPDNMFNGAPLEKYNASDTENVVLTGVTTIGQYAFKGTSIASVKIPASVTSIGNYAFQDCASLTTVEFEAPAAEAQPQDLAIGNSAFYGSGITAITLPARVNSLGTGVFQNCASLLTADLSAANLTELNTSLFQGCTVLTTVKLPTKLAAGGLDKAFLFKECTALTDIWYDGDAVLTAPTQKTTRSGKTKKYNQIFLGIEHEVTFHVKDATQYADTWGTDPQQFVTSSGAANGGKATFVTIETEPSPQPGGPGTDTGTGAGDDA